MRNREGRGEGYLGDAYTSNSVTMRTYQVLGHIGIARITERRTLPPPGRQAGGQGWLCSTKQKKLRNALCSRERLRVPAAGMYLSGNAGHDHHTTPHRSHFFRLQLLSPSAKTRPARLFLPRKKRFTGSGGWKRYPFYYCTCRNI